MAETKHTPGMLVAWPGKKRENLCETLAPLKIEDGGCVVAYVVSDRFRPGEANAARLALCWNAHDQLVEACRRAQGWFGQFGYNHYGIAVADDAPDPEEVVRELRAALALAEPEKREAVGMDEPNRLVVEACRQKGLEVESIRCGRGAPAAIAAMKARKAARP